MRRDRRAAIAAAASVVATAGVAGWGFAEHPGVRWLLIALFPSIVAHASPARS